MQTTESIAGNQTASIVQMRNLNCHEIKTMEHPEVLYQPTCLKKTPLYHFTKFVEKKYQLNFPDFWAFRRWSVENYVEFWECVWHFYNIKTSHPYTQVCELKNPIHKSQWFKGAYLNYAENVLRIRDSRTALITVDESDHVEYFTYSQLYDAVRVYAQALRDAGIQKGDTVACYMTNKKEAIFAHFATTSIGAIWTSTLPTTGPQGVVYRLVNLKPKILFTCGNFVTHGTGVNMDKRIEEISEGLPSLLKIVYVLTNLNAAKSGLSKIPKCVPLTEFLACASQSTTKKDIVFEQVAFDHPVSISFTSGTTGQPKGFLHNNGILLMSLRSNGLSKAFTEGDVILTRNPSGWISWSIEVQALMLGSTLLLYEGQPFLESATRLWDVVDKFGVTSFCLRCLDLEEMEKRRYIPTSNHSLKTLRQMLPVGSNIRKPSYDFIVKSIKSGLVCSSVYGLTEIFGALSGIDHNMPIYKGQIQRLALGIDVQVLNQNGDSVVDKKGDLVIATPFPSLPKALTGDPDDAKLTDTYLKSHPGFWCTNDTALIDGATNGLVVVGRTDECIIVKSGEVWCSEIQNLLVGFEGIFDTAYVQHFSSQRIILFLRMENERSLTDEIKSRIEKRIEDFLAVFAIPDVILVAPEFPYNLNGKKLHGVVKDIINNKQAIENLENIANISSIEYFRTLNLDRN